MLQLAVMAGVIPVNPARDVSPLKGDRPKGAPQLSEDQVTGLLGTVAASAECEAIDMGDPIIMLMATGLRRSELLALRRSDYNRKAGEIAITGKVVRITGRGSSGSTRSGPRPDAGRCGCRRSRWTC
ncbi:integrase [Mycobacterium sp. pW045]|uniref:integrase n=1 Tax=Mycobacterium sp. pW045 TaxID=3238984 RepID=UPI00351B83B3